MFTQRREFLRVLGLKSYDPVLAGLLGTGIEWSKKRRGARGAREWEERVLPTVSSPLLPPFFPFPRREIGGRARISGNCLTFDL